MSQCNDVAMYRKPCIDVTQFCNDLCIGHNVAMIRDTFVALWCSPIHAEPTGFIASLKCNKKKIKKTSKHNTVKLAN
jgi:hypothetical protein